jgi:hypothetical protein
MYPKTFFSSNDAKQRNGKCFVIMPFAPEFNEVYETIREALEGQELSFICTRADDLVGGGHIIEDILRGIAEAEIVIADLTGRNPNVFYELGIVQMVKNVEKVIMLSQDAESIPFDLKAFRSIIYKQTIQGAKELNGKLIDAVKAVAEKSFRFKLLKNTNYKFPHKVMGADHCAYDFEISDGFFAIDGAKFMLKVTRYVAGEPPTVTSNGGYGLSIGERRHLPNFPWEIQLESVAEDIATFVVQRQL